MKDETDRPTDCPRAPETVPRVENLVGLALSGGGIRSATFNLGFLQGLAQLGLLEKFDYLSTVSGGGFIGAWWGAWLSRPQHIKGQLFPNSEDLELQRHEASAQLLSGNTATAGQTKAQSRNGPPPSPSAAPASSQAGPGLPAAAQGSDPIHFVRIFSDYLTPKTGLMSPDTWRLIAYLIRSLLLTWLALVPILFATILLAQSVYLFRADTVDAFLAVGPIAGPDARLGFLAVPAAAALAIYLTLTALWVIETAASRVVAAVAFLGVIAGVFLTRAYFVDASSSMSAAAWVALAAALMTVVVYFVRSVNLLEVYTPDGGGASAAATVTASPLDRRTWLTHKQELVLKISVFAGVLLVAAAFAHDVVSFLFGTVQSGIAEALGKAGGWGAVAVTAISTLYTVSKKAPATAGAPTPPPLLGRVLMAIAPPLLVVMLLFGLAALSHHWLMSLRGVLPSKREALAWAGISLAAVEVFLTVYECLTDQEASPPKPAAASENNVPADPQRRWPRRWMGLLLLACLAVLVSGHLSLAASEDWSGLFARGLNKCALLLLIAIGIVTCIPTSLRWSLSSARPAILLAIAAVTTTLAALTSGGPMPLAAAPAVAWVGVMALLGGALLIGLVIALGWLADPNLISLHGFYKARLARAYLGASNVARNNETITEAAPGDDLALKDLWNHDAGGPYHLINTSLNLVGGADLAMAQRLCENFIMSRYHCGSARAGYRCTSKYMSGELSLATAVAISGAAVSPTMGSQTPSAAMTLLLSLFNVRLGFWAPTPSGRRWYESHARLWPFYLLRETLANTGSIGTYCYLTDGGHFDNTGLYALVERACQHIVVCDCGADPQFSFDDIGNAIRRCRIDFGAEIDLSIKDFVLAPALEGVGTTYVGRGKIRYQSAHLEFLGLTAAQASGDIIWVKPMVTDHSAADVRQYRRSHREFPQQSTAEQWYDESQFESYRRLGYESAAFVAPLGPAAPGVPSSAGHGGATVPVGAPSGA